MNAIAPALAQQAAELADLTPQFGRRVDVLSLGVHDRTGHLTLSEPGRISANGACRMVRAADGWIALNLAREEDRDLIPAWLHGDFGEDTWAQVERLAPRRTCADLLADGEMLGLPIAAVGEVSTAALEAPRLRLRTAVRQSGRLRVIDLSALWAGPMCGAVLAAMGADVVRVESLRRPDPTRAWTPRLFDALNGSKTTLPLDLTTRAGRAKLNAEIAAADILITGVRPRGLLSLDLSIQGMFAANPGLVWVAVTGYGWASNRVAFGDDAAAAGGLVAWTAGEPRFLGDALADPVTGLAAAAGALRGLLDGGGILVDASLARCAAGAARVCGLRVEA